MIRTCSADLNFHLTLIDGVCRTERNGNGYLCMCGKHLCNAAQPLAGPVWTLGMLLAAYSVIVQRWLWLAEMSGIFYSVFASLRLRSKSSEVWATVGLAVVKPVWKRESDCGCFAGCSVSTLTEKCSDWLPRASELFSDWLTTESADIVVKHSRRNRPTFSGHFRKEKLQCVVGTYEKCACWTEDVTLHRTVEIRLKNSRILWKLN